MTLYDKDGLIKDALSEVETRNQFTKMVFNNIQREGINVIDYEMIQLWIGPRTNNRSNTSHDNLKRNMELDIEVLSEEDSDAIMGRLRQNIHVHNSNPIVISAPAPAPAPPPSSSTRPPSTLSSFFNMYDYVEDDHDVVIIYGDVFSFEGTYIYLIMTLLIMIAED